MKYLFSILILFGIFFEINAQVGVNTLNPKGALDVQSDNQGLVVPRVPSVDSVTDGNGNPAVDGTIVYDTTRKAMMFRIDGGWVSLTLASGGPELRSLNDLYEGDYTYIKASNADTSDYFANCVALSGDGGTLVVGALGESSDATGINGDQDNDQALLAGAAYVFAKNNGSWIQQAYLKGSNTGAHSYFGAAVDISHDGNVLVVGASRHPYETSSGPGAVYVFKRVNGVWSQDMMLTSSNGETFDVFGTSVSLDSLGQRLVVGASGEDSNATGIGGNQADNSATNSGAVYIFDWDSVAWSQSQYIKASNTGANDGFGQYVDLSSNGNVLAVGAKGEDSNAVGINGDESDNSARDAGAVYIFSDNSGSWQQEAYVKASNTDSLDVFGVVSLSGDGKNMLVGALAEDSGASGINGDQNNNSLPNAGAAYLFHKDSAEWNQIAYIKASNPDSEDDFGGVVDISGNGMRIAIGAQHEGSSSTGIGGEATNNAASSSGAVYVYDLQSGYPVQKAYVKASNTDPYDSFSYVRVNYHGTILVVGAPFESSLASGINGNQFDNTAYWAGAAYIIK